VAVIIQPDGDNFGGETGGEELDIAQFIGAVKFFNLAEGSAGQGLHSLSLQDSVFSFSADFITYNLHSGSLSLFGFGCQHQIEIIDQPIPLTPFPW
jgi:hypothetical protein